MNWRVTTERMHIEDRARSSDYDAAATCGASGALRTKERIFGLVARIEAASNVGRTDAIERFAQDQTLDELIGSIERDIAADIAAFASSDLVRASTKVVGPPPTFGLNVVSSAFICGCLADAGLTLAAHEASALTGSMEPSFSRVMRPPPNRPANVARIAAAMVGVGGLRQPSGRRDRALHVAASPPPPLFTASMDPFHSPGDWRGRCRARAHCFRSFGAGFGPGSRVWVSWSDTGGPLGTPARFR